MPWVTVRHPETGGVANVIPDAVEQLRGLGWMPITESCDEPPVLVSDLLNGLVASAAPTSEPAAPVPAIPKTPSKKAADAASEKEMTRGE